ncbi:MAG: hypothetical protein Q7V09_15050 [Hydrogenophaga sp.]|jgi:hypothetical protein|uniref:hypothetical protein n=1 Tax=Hydrogenophaga sp. TaxID=1904254 RepID=UPI00271B4F37|nr:hypothetical protein [Hydrogenophaga sp.]MDO9031749.1 hypothetical protein [Hydrogenophaga sp.]
MESRYTVVLACAIAGAAFTSPTWAINKCTQPDGSIAFQDAPCAGKGEALNVRPASGAVRAAPAPTGSVAELAAKQQTEAQRIESNIAASQKERRLRELTEREVPQAYGAIRAHAQACKDEQDRLEQAKGRYVQNLYGKTDAAQRAAEQAAAAGRCDTKDRELRERHATLRAECQQLSGCK